MDAQHAQLTRPAAGDGRIPPDTVDLGYYGAPVRLITFDDGPRVDQPLHVGEGLHLGRPVPVLRELHVQRVAADRHDGRLRLHLLGELRHHRDGQVQTLLHRQPSEDPREGRRLP